MIKVKMRYADAREQTYGILFSSVNVHVIRGAKHNKFAPHRIKVWCNIFRKNPHPGEVKWTNFGSIGGDGEYLDPNNRGTDDPITVTTSAEATCITSDGRNTGTEASGQVYGLMLTVGDPVMLVLPDGTEHGPYVIRQRPLHDPHLEKM